MNLTRTNIVSDHMQYLARTHFEVYATIHGLGQCNRHFTILPLTVQREGLDLQAVGEVQAGNGWRSRSVLWM